MKTQLKNTGVDDWKAQMLVMAKDSLKIPQDQESCLLLRELKEFEAYISAQYKIGINLLEDLLSKLFAMGKAEDTADSIRMITEALNVLRTIKSKKLWTKFIETHL